MLKNRAPSAITQPVETRVSTAVMMQMSPSPRSPVTEVTGCRNGVCFALRPQGGAKMPYSVEWPVSALSLHMKSWATCTQSAWVLRTLKKGYRMQFSVAPPQFKEIVYSRAPGESASFLLEEISTLRDKGAIRVVPPEEMHSGFYSRYFLVPKKHKHDSNFIWLLVATILSCGWIIYLTYYNSRNIGLILTLIINRLYKDGYIHIGSFSFSVLSGKVMFRDVYYINQDMSIRIQDGFLIFRWWKMYNPKQKQHDPKAETRLYVTVNGFEFHVYNRTDLYARLQETFGLEPTLQRPKKDEERGREDRNKTLESVNIKAESQDPSSSWRSLIPVIKVNISTGRLAFGNHYLPQTLCMNFEDACLTYATKPPSSHLDQYMHIVKGSLENVRVMLVPSPRYLGMQNDEPPRLMGEGFVVMQSNDVDIYYYQDEPGLVPVEQESGEEAETSSEDDKLQDLPPCWGLDIVCGKGTDFNYGPWADRQRDCLWKFFLPADYQAMKATEVAQPGKPRQIQAFELRMNIIADATIDLLFTKNRETNAIHVNVGAGSYLEVNIPMTVGENGYSPTIKGQLLHVDTTSSMQYRTLLEAEMLAFHVIASYPRVWNMPQSWQCEIEVYKATYHFIYAQKSFFTDLIQDWASDSAPDIYSFVPYSWKFKILFHQFEMIWAANQHNWIDCSTKQQENVYLAACGETLNIDFTLPFNEFVPTTSIPASA
ncbi:transmembrane protein KIAA1109 homolog [Haplochromis burtoni]|uniref:transmembrane protein KIAA1109 homolog n=1 Tax=Haplochromis burtoni TaxID=8153 RepID=UPI001C2D4EBA|nr:transmembrane protein KIAA1109 homolog [Haplochromis burtoni]